MLKNNKKNLELPNSFIPTVRQICIVTRDLDQMVRRYADELGIGPWWINNYEAPDLTDTTYHGRSSSYSMKLALAWTGDINWEIIEPIKGPNIYEDFLESNEFGIQHIGIMLSDLGMSWSECHHLFKDRGFEVIQEGRWKQVQFCYFNTLQATGTIIEVIDRPASFVRPEPLYWYPTK